MVAIGVIVKSSSPVFPYAVEIKSVGDPTLLGISYVLGDENHVHESQIGQPVVIKFQKEDQFCTIVPLRNIQRALERE